MLPLPGASGAALVDDPVAQADPPPYALQPPWWDGGPYDLSETVRIVAEHLRHARAA